MRHLFFIHSNITALVSKLVIQHLSLDYNDVIISCPSSFKKSFSEFKEVHNVRYEIALKEDKKLSYYNPTKYKRIDEYINSLVKDNKYALYLPHIVAKDYHIIASHPNCMKINFIEEGLSSYVFQTRFKGELFYEKSILKQFSLLIKNTLYMNDRMRFFTPKHFFDTAYFKRQKIEFFGLHHKSFNFIKNEKITILPNFISSTFKEKSNKNYFLLDALTENNLLTTTTLIAALTSIIDKISSKEIYIKFHPLQSNEIKEQILIIIKHHNKNAIVLPDDLVLEEELKNTKDLLIIHGFVSSLLLYAKIFGHEVHSYVDLLKEDNLFTNHFNRLNIKQFI